MIVLAIRHGVTSWNAQQRWQGATDIPLTPEGADQAKRAAERLRAQHWRGTTVFCSSLTRSVVTAEVICAELGIPEPTSIPQLGERELGRWEGLSVDEVEAHYPGAIDAWTRGKLAGPPDGETDSQVAARFEAACRQIHSAVADSTGPALVITHAGVLHAVDKSVGVGYSKYGPLCGRWFDLTEEKMILDGQVDLLSDAATVPDAARRP